MSRKQLVLLIICLSHRDVLIQLINKKGLVVAEQKQVWSFSEKSVVGSELDPLEIVFMIQSMIQRLFSENSGTIFDIQSIGVSSDSSIALAWNKKTGAPITPAISVTEDNLKTVLWDFKKAPLSDHIRQTTGMLETQPSPCAAIKCLSRHFAQSLDLVNPSQIMFGMIESWIVYHLTGLDQIICDESIASKTMCWNIHTQEWDDLLLDECGLSSKQMPKITNLSADMGRTKGFVPIPDGIPISVVAHSQFLQHLGGQVSQCGDALLHLNDDASFIGIHTGSQPISVQEGQLAYLPKTDSMAGYSHIQELLSPPMLTSLFEDQFTIDHILSTDLSDIQLNPNLWMVMSSNISNNQPNRNVHISGLKPESSFKDVLGAYFECYMFQIKDTLTQHSFFRDGMIKELRVNGIFAELSFFLQLLADGLQLPIVRQDSKQLEIAGLLALMDWVMTRDSGAFLTKKKHKVYQQFIPNQDPISSFANFSTWVRIRDTMQSLTV